MGRYGEMARRVAVKFDTRKEMQEYKREHDMEPGTKLELRNKQELRKRREARVAERVADIWSGGAVDERG